MFKSQAKYTAAKEDGQYDFLGLTSPNETHDPAWLEEIEIAFRTRRDSGALSELLNEWAAPAALHVLVSHSGEWKDIDPYKVIPSRWLQALDKVNETRPDGQKIRSFLGEGSYVQKTLSIPLYNDDSKKAVFVLKHWIALDDGPDQYPIFQPTDDLPRKSNFYDGEFRPLLLVLVREQDLPWMYSEEANRHAIFPDIALQDLTRFVLANGTESDFVRSMIREQFKTSNGLRATHLISADSPSSVKFLLNELGSLVDQESIPFILRRLDHQLSFKEDLPSTPDLRSSIAKSWKSFYESLTAEDWVYTLETEIHAFTESCVRIQLQALQKWTLTPLIRIKLIQTVFKAFPGHSEFLGTICDSIDSMQVETAINILVKLISCMRRPEPAKELRIFLGSLFRLFWKKLSILNDQRLFRTHFLGLILMSNEMEEPELVSEVTRRMLLEEEASHQCHIACEKLLEKEMISATSEFYLHREREIREWIQTIEEKEEFNGSYMSPKIPLQIKVEHRQALMQFLQGNQETIHLTVLTHQEGLELTRILNWRRPKWCQFNQPSDHCEENEGFSVACSIGPWEGGTIAVEVKKTDDHFQQQRKFLSALREELAWLLLHHNDKKKPLSSN